MAPPLTVPAEDAGIGSGTRWHVRTSSLAETSAELSRIWGTLARESLTQAMSAELARAVREDPRLAGDANALDELRVRTRASVLTLVVVAPTPETQERALAAVAALASRHPSRAVILAPGDPDGPSAFEGHLHASCQIPDRTTAEVCTEEILLRLGGELAGHLASTVAPLLIHDLPVVLWWPDDVPFDSPVLRELVATVDRLFVDSGAFRDDGLARLGGMAATIANGVVVHDVSWMRLLLWRELLAGLFDHPLLRPELRGVSALRIDVSRPGTEVRLTKAVLIAGWLAAQLGWSVVAPLTADADGAWRARLRAGRREIPLEIRPVASGVDGPVRGAGSLVRVELEGSRSHPPLRVRVTRQADHLLGSADWQGAQIARRAARLDAFDEMPFLAEALDRSGGDRVFSRALAAAVRIAGGDPEPSAAGAAGAVPRPRRRAAPSGAARRRS